MRAKYKNRVVKVNWFRRNKVGITDGDNYLTVNKNKVNFLDGIFDSNPKENIAEEDIEDDVAYINKKAEDRG